MDWLERRGDFLEYVESKRGIIRIQLNCHCYFESSIKGFLQFLGFIGVDKNRLDLLKEVIQKDQIEIDIKVPH